MNVELLRKVAEHIKEEPRRLDMDEWLIEGLPQGYHDESIPACGTVACIAGWSLKLSGSDVPTYTPHIRGKAEEVLGITHSQAYHLFYVVEWPLAFRQPYEDADSDRNRELMAEITASRIEYFIKRGR